MMATNVQRTKVILYPDRTRVLLRPFLVASDRRAINLCAQVMALPESEVHTLLRQVQAEFGDRHVKIEEFLKRRFDQIRPSLPAGAEPSEERKLLLGAYFSHEYSLEATALFNPSIVPHPDQSGVPPGSLRFILSLRATGEGHVSSIVFRTGCLDVNGAMTIDTPGRYRVEPQPALNGGYNNLLFERKLHELGLGGGFSQQVLKTLGDSFTLE